MIEESKKVDNNRMRKSKHPGWILNILFAICICFSVSLFLTAQEKEKDQEKKKKQKTITEEIIVEAEAPRDLPVSFVSTVKSEKIKALLPKDLSEVLSFTSGTFISAGSKNEFRIKIRGLQSQRIVLLYDGIPVYEPFFNSFDLMEIKTFELTGTFKMGKIIQQPFTKTLSAASPKIAQELLYSLIGSKHRCPRRSIVIKSVKEVKDE